MSDTAIASHDICQLGATAASIHGMYNASGETSIALSFRAVGPLTGLSTSFHGSTEEMRKFAEELIRHCDITDAEQAKLDAGEEA